MRQAELASELPEYYFIIICVLLDSRIALYQTESIHHSHPTSRLDAFTKDSAEGEQDDDGSAAADEDSHLQYFSFAPARPLAFQLPI